MNIRRIQIGGFSAVYYWSSSEFFVDDFAWAQSFSYGAQSGLSNDTMTYVRPVRAF